MFNPFSELTSKLFGGLLALSLVTLGPALYFTRATLADARVTIKGLTEWQTDIVEQVRLASKNPKIDKTTVSSQIAEMGYIRIQLDNAIDTQNAAISEMERQSAEAKQMAIEAERKRRAAVPRAADLARKLRYDSRAPAPSDDMEASVRETQDLLYEEGL